MRLTDEQIEAEAWRRYPDDGRAPATKRMARNTWIEASKWARDAEAGRISDEGTVTDDACQIRIERSADGGRKVSAIKLWSNVFGCDLITGKEAIENGETGTVSRSQLPAIQRNADQLGVTVTVLDEQEREAER